MSFRTTRSLAAVALGLALASCGNDRASTQLGNEDAFGATGLRRLTRFEVVSTLDDVFGVSTTDLESLLPEDMVGTNPFDNNYLSQTVSPVVIGAYAGFAQAYATRLATTPDLAQRLGGCTPSGASDEACFVAIATQAGRRMFRRPLTTDELTRYTETILPFAATSGQFSTAVELLGLLLVQHPAFLYRIERSEGTLDDYEIATRMAFLIWGSGPDDELLDAAEDGKLGSDGTRERQAERMLEDPRSRRNWQRFHAQWLGYSAAPLPAGLAADLTQETNQLVDRIVFDQDADWLALFRWNETFVTPALASHYKLSPASSAGWVQYPAGRAGGVLTHGSFLSLGAKFGDTSPTVRGYEIFKRLTCGHLGTIPTTVDTDQPPGAPSDCKPQRYMMASTPGCEGCHSITDNIGFGLENYGVSGEWRTTELNKPQCAIEAKGSWAGQPYSGPEQLGQLISEDPRVSACATTQLFRFLTGRDEVDTDAAALAALDDDYQDNRSLQHLVIELVKSPSIAFRKGE